jgi:hypothetical protein
MSRFSWQSDSVMNELFEGYPFLRVLSKCTHLDYSSLLVPQGPLSSSLGHFDSLHRCHSILYQTCKDARIPLRAQMCRYLQPAFLKAEALQALQELESSLPNGTAIVVYAAPLQIRERDLNEVSTRRRVGSRFFRDGGRPLH